MPIDRTNSSAPPSVIPERAADSLRTALLDRIRSKQARIGVIGLGYVGLPLAVEFADAGLTVTPVDLDVTKVDSVRRGISYIPDVPHSRLVPLVVGGRLRATT